MSAPTTLIPPEDEEKEIRIESSCNQGSVLFNLFECWYWRRFADLEMIGDILQQENQEIEALLTLMSDCDSPTLEEDNSGTDYGVEDDDWLFLEPALAYQDGTNDAADSSRALIQTDQDVDMVTC